ncbi:hypothetical protein TNCV_3582121 [Trichonephila clavipes]|nr:hypothetical protein TNCV_3582121 [Trichonephila clavipes]
MSNRCPSKTSKLSTAGCLRMSEPLAIETSQKIRNVWANFAVKECFVSTYCYGITEKSVCEKKRLLICKMDRVSISRSPDLKRLTDFGSPPILMSAL